MQRPTTEYRKQQERPPKRSRALLVVLGVLLLLLIAGGFSLVQRHREQKRVVEQTQRMATPTVAVVNPTREDAEDALVLPGQLQAYIEAPLYARTTGYLMRWYKDIGSPVTKGELLAHIDTPEVDQELMQARAARQQAEAQLELARVSAERWQNLRKSDSVSQQEADQQTSAYAQGKANVAAADANVKRLEQLEGFKNIYAPFAGVITRRNTDIGALVNAGAGQKELFDLAQIDPLRVYVNVPQNYASSIQKGQTASLELQERPGQKFAGKVVRTSDAIDPATRTLLTEVDVPNREGKLLPGAYAQVKFDVGVKVQRLSVPVNALLFRAEGPRAAVVENGMVKLHPVQIGRDFGSSIEILGGVSPGDQIIVNPADALEDGDKVNVRPERPANAQAPQQGSEGNKK
ncbi:MAG: efflux RND transporter periplasmic adaptor subunit [Acidobacteriales bacterium]|nr:efflux RND transporter periplasmic adaptor subunit [Terriglobales bacterium]